MSDPTSSRTSQPTQNQAFQTSGNPAETGPTEQAIQSHENSGSAIDRRTPTSQSSGEQDATPSALGYGVHGAPAGEEKYGFTDRDVGRNKELEGEQMRAPGEGAVASSVESKPGAGGGENDFASNLERKKEEQEPFRANKNSGKGEQMNVADVLNEHRQTN